MSCTDTPNMKKRLTRLIPKRLLTRSSPKPPPSPAPRPLPHLPPELWIQILHYATTSSSPSSSDRTVSFLSLAHSHCHFPHRLAHYRASMHIKSSLTLVSKAFLAHAQPILFEFVWISRASEARALAQVLSGCGPSSSSGKYIKRMHIETPSLERCDPADLRTILDCAPGLEVYSDYRSVRRNMIEERHNPRSAPKELLSTLTRPNNALRRLSWTNYDDLSFHLHMSPMLSPSAAHLEFLELTFCSSSPHLHTSQTPLSSALPKLFHPSALPLTLPSLRALKATLDNATFLVLAAWDMPALRNISVLSADFSYASEGFSQFFKHHGPKLLQLELGHSSATIEEHYLTSPLPLSRSPVPNPLNTPLATWCPNLVEFICSASAEWNWQHPDWIAPHVLLPAHPTLTLIGIRDIDKRLREEGGDGYFGLLEQMGSLLRREVFPSLRYVRDLSWESDVLRRGVGAGVVPVPVPARGLLKRLKGGTAASSNSPSNSDSQYGYQEGEEGERMYVSGKTRAVLRFWGAVLGRCRDAGVWMEDCRGVNVTFGDLRRAEAGLGRRFGGGAGAGGMGGC